MNAFARLFAVGILYTSPCSHDEHGTMHEHFRGLLITGEKFHSISENRYFTTYPEIFSINTMREYSASDRYIPASEELADRLRPDYSPKIFAISELIIRDDTVLCIHNHSAYIIVRSDTDITSAPILLADIPVFAQTIAPFVPVSLP